MLLFEIAQSFASFALLSHIESFDIGVALAIAVRTELDGLEILSRHPTLAMVLINHG